MTERSRSATSATSRVDVLQRLIGVQLSQERDRATLEATLDKQSATIQRLAAKSQEDQLMLERTSRTLRELMDAQVSTNERTEAKIVELLRENEELKSDKNSLELQLLKRGKSSMRLGSKASRRSGSRASTQGGERGLEPSPSQGRSPSVRIVLDESQQTPLAVSAMSPELEIVASPADGEEPAPRDTAATAGDSVVLSEADLVYSDDEDEEETEEESEDETALQNMLLHQKLAAAETEINKLKRDLQVANEVAERNQELMDSKMSDSELMKELATLQSLNSALTREVEDTQTAQKKAASSNKDELVAERLLHSEATMTLRESNHSLLSEVGKLKFQLHVAESEISRLQERYGPESVIGKRQSVACSTQDFGVLALVPSGENTADDAEGATQERLPLRAAEREQLIKSEEERRDALLARQQERHNAAIRKLRTDYDRVDCDLKVSNEKVVSLSKEAAIAHHAHKKASMELSAAKGELQRERERFRSAQAKLEGENRGLQVTVKEQNQAHKRALEAAREDADQSRLVLESELLTLKMKARERPAVLYRRQESVDGEQENAAAAVDLEQELNEERAAHNVSMEALRKAEDRIKWLESTAREAEFRAADAEKSSKESIAKHSAAQRQFDDFMERQRRYDAEKGSQILHLSQQLRSANDLHSASRYEKDRSKVPRAAYEDLCVENDMVRADLRDAATVLEAMMTELMISTPPPAEIAGLGEISVVLNSPAVPKGLETPIRNHQAAKLLLGTPGSHMVIDTPAGTRFTHSICAEDVRSINETPLASRKLVDQSKELFSVVRALAGKTPLPGTGGQTTVRRAQRYDPDATEDKEFGIYEDTNERKEGGGRGTVSDLDNTQQPVFDDDSSSDIDDSISTIPTEDSRSASPEPRPVET